MPPPRVPLAFERGKADDAFVKDRSAVDADADAVRATARSSGSLLARYDHARNLQVLANLVGNAVKLSEEGGRIDLVAERVDEKRTLATVFERFSQANKYARSASASTSPDASSRRTASRPDLGGELPGRGPLVLLHASGGPAGSHLRPLIL